MLAVHIEGPLLRGPLQAIMATQLAQGMGPGMALEIRRRSHHIFPPGAEPAGNQGGVRQGPGADRHIEPLIHDIHPPVGEIQLH